MLEDFFKLSPYELSKDEKQKLLTQELLSLTNHHKLHCKEYAAILQALNFNEDSVKSYYDLPFIPVRLFKEYDLMSIDKSQVFKTMTSSGTTGQKVSKIL